MMWQVMYRGENSAKLRKRYNIGRYIVITCKIKGDKKKCVEFAREMNNHVKKFHPEQYGKNIYFVRKV